jgi:S-methyl-5-thioribose kinase
VIDPEFAVYGPFGFDVGMLIANFLMAYFAQSGYEARPGERDDFRAWTLDAAEDIWTRFREEFARLWRTERRGILFPAALYEDQGHALAAEQALGALPASRFTGAFSASPISRSSSISPTPTRGPRARRRRCGSGAISRSIARG